MSFHTIHVTDAGVGIFLAIWILFLRYSAFLRARQPFNNIKVIACPLGPWKAPGYMIPTSCWNPGVLYTWRNRATLYREPAASTFVMVSYAQHDQMIISKSFDIIKQVGAPRSIWDRNDQMGEFENIPAHAYNVGTAQVDKYRRHLRIAAPAFNQDLYFAAWDETIAAFTALSDSQRWGGIRSLEVPDLTSVTAKFTLAIIAKKGFGMDLPWDNSKLVAKDEVTLREAFELVSTYAPLRVGLPHWVLKLPIKLLRRINVAHSLLLSTLQRHIEGYRAVQAESDEAEHNVFKSLLKANDSELPGNSLNDDELLSNVFFLLFAGHETSSKCLSITLAFLACYPEEQERVYRYIQDNIPTDTVPAFGDFETLRPVLNCLMESLRLLPIGPLIMREATEDGLLNVPELPEPLFIRKGTRFAGDIIGINYDPERYPDPETFCPSRWADKADLTPEDYISFGYGVHACLGRRFALYEMVCFVTLFIRTWRIVPTLERGQSIQAWRKKYLDEDVALGITFGPLKVPVQLEKR